MGTKGRLGDAGNAEHLVEMPVLAKRLMCSVATESVCMLLGAVHVPPHTPTDDEYCHYSSSGSPQRA